MMGIETQRLVRRVAARRRLDLFVKRFALCAIVGGVAYAAALAAGRLLGLAPEWFTPATLSLIAAGAAVMALVLVARIPDHRVARLIDSRTGQDDLMLTAVLLEGSLGQYQQLVRTRAEQRAVEIQAKDVVPFRWGTSIRNVVLVAVVLLVAVLYVPALDPFGAEAARLRQVKQRQAIAASRKVTARRAQRIRRAKPETEQSEPVKRAVEELKMAFETARPKQRKVNLKKLSERQKQLGYLWRKMGEKRLRDALARTPAKQRFGSRSAKKAQQWKDELKAGKTASLRKELAALKDTLRRLRKAAGTPEEQKLRRLLKERLKKLSNFMANEMNAKNAHAALSRALDQLAQSGKKGLSDDALDALDESLDLAKLEFEDLAQAARDLQKLEAALEAIQLAKILNQADLLDGEKLGQAEAMAEYKEMFKQMMACKACGGKGCAACDGTGLCAACRAMGMGKGGMGLGMRGPGRGRGNVAPEDPDAQTAFERRKSETAKRAGKVLLQLKTKQLSDPGEAREAYLEQIKQVRQAASEAILKEQIPPGYHEAIKKYFDSMEKSSEQPAAK